VRTVSTCRSSSRYSLANTIIALCPAITSDLTMTRAARLALSALALAASACRQPRIDSLIPLDRCYSLTIGPWSSGPYYLSPPAAISLDTVRVVDSWFGDDLIRRRVRPDIKHTSEHIPPPTWRLVGNDSLRIEWTTGYTAYYLSLGPEQDGVRHGAYESFHDVIRIPEPPAPRAEVAARRMNCGAVGLQ
jgi:hypothetical protein